MTTRQDWLDLRDKEKSLRSLMDWITILPVVDLTALRAFGNINYPDRCRLDLFGEIKIDRNNHKATVYFNAVSEANDQNGWFPDVYEGIFAKKGAPGKVTFFQPHLIDLSVKLYHRVQMGNNNYSREEIALESRTTGLDLFDKKGQIKNVECARTVRPITFDSGAALECMIQGRKYGGYWAGAHAGRYGGSDQPERKDNVKFAYTFTMKIPSIKDLSP